MAPLIMPGDRLIVREQSDVDDGDIATDFVYTVSGDAMEPEYWDGDKVLATVTKEIDFGEVGIFLAGAEYIMREYGPEGLYAKNPNYQAMPADGVQLVGKVKGRIE